MQAIFAAKKVDIDTDRCEKLEEPIRFKNIV